MMPPAGDIELAVLAGVAALIRPLHAVPLAAGLFFFIAGAVFHAVRHKAFPKFWGWLLAPHLWWFTAGFLFFQTAGGMPASGIGGWVWSVQTEIRIAGGLCAVAIGLEWAGILPWRRFFSGLAFQDGGYFPAWFGSLLVGLGVAAGWTPVPGPVLASIMLYSGTAGAEWPAAVLMVSYWAGFCFLFTLGGQALHQFLGLFSLGERPAAWLAGISAAGLVLFGVMLLAGRLMGPPVF